MKSGQEISLQVGNLYPYDDGEPQAAVDWAVMAARGVVADLRDRQGIKWGFEGVGGDVQVEIVASLAQVIRLAYGPVLDVLGRVGRVETFVEIEGHPYAKVKDVDGDSVTYIPLMVGVLELCREARNVWEVANGGR